jgi:uncharacterized protein YprB with RNaseH-like and TPR domain
MGKARKTVKDTDVEIDPLIEGKPSVITDSYWVFAFNTVQSIPNRKFTTFKPGKWLLFVDDNEIDSTWDRIKQATEDGILGIQSKAATAKPNQLAASKNMHVICVYTYNWEDRDDVYRVEKALRSLGVEITLYYKTDQDTTAKNYKVKGASNISKYISKATKSFEKFSLDSLYGVGSEKLKNLQNIGLHNFDDLLSFDTSQRLEGVGVSSEYLNKLKLYALSQIENRIYKLAPVHVPTNEILHFDIETESIGTAQTKRVWAIAVHYNNKVKRFYAENWSKEIEILKDFLKFIKDIKNPSLYSYSSTGFDKTTLASAMKRHDLDADYFNNCDHIDLCTLLKQNFVIPVKSYGLKEVGKYLGYEFRNEELTGLDVAMQYFECQLTGKKLPKRIFDYIDDDVKAMDHIFRQIQTRVDIQDLFVQEMVE